MLDLVADIRYEERKARQFLDMDMQDVARRIRLDCSALKLPHPPQANIQRPTLNGVTVSWTTRKNSALYTTVTSTLADQDGPGIRRAKSLCSIESIRLEEFTVMRKPPPQPLWKTRGRSPSVRRPRSRSRSPPPRRTSFGRARQVEKIDTVIQSLRQLDDSLNPEEPGAISSQAAINSLPTPTSPRIRRSRFETGSEIESRLRDELASNQEEMTAAIFKAAEIERELEALGIDVGPDTAQGTDDIRAQLTRSVTEMILERKKRADLELIVEDVRRECHRPIIVPAMLEVMEGISLEVI